MDKDSSEIAKLKERILKDPKSKLFVPLAEEYKKIGNIDMAVSVLTEGLKNNPGYITARSFLGRLLIEQGNLTDAQRELEEVVKAIPDNLLAQRKLGDIFILQGKSADALARYKTALSLNVADKDLAALVEDLEAGKDVSGRISKPLSPPMQPEAKQPEPAPQKPAAPAMATLPPTQTTGTTSPAAAVSQATVVQKPAPIAPVSPEQSPSVQEAAESVEEIEEIESIEPEIIHAAPPGVTSTEDINTDTLAELYIAQGFYDKAIEIYQRMLADRPDNAALQMKLLKLHTLAGGPPPAAPFVSPAMPVPESSDDSGVLQETGVQDQVPVKEQTVKVAVGHAAIRRKETIDRLESWLKNILKEKPG